MKNLLFSIGMLVFTTAAFSQNCFRFARTPFFTGPATNGTFSLPIDFNNNGTKALQVVVKCGSTVILDTCFTANGTGTTTITDLVCPQGIGGLSVQFTQRAGSCNSAACDSLTVTPIGGPLPVKLNSFSAVRSKQTVTLNWSTDLEIDSKEFVVERAESNTFRAVATINSNGNSTVRRVYSFNDRNENSGVTYYRLKSVDMNGRFTYSEIKTVKGMGMGADVTVFPNPARTNSRISLVGVSPNSLIQLVDFSGKVVRNVTSTSVNTFDLNGINHGSYLLRITDRTSNEVINKKITVTN